MATTSKTSAPKVTTPVKSSTASTPAAAPKAAAPSSTVYSIGWKNYTATQIAGMSDPVKAQLAAAVKSGKVAVTSWGKTLNMTGTTTPTQTGSTAGSGNKPTVNTPVKPTVTPPVAPVIGAKYWTWATQTPAQIAAAKAKTDAANKMAGKTNANSDIEFSWTKDSTTPDKAKTDNTYVNPQSSQKQEGMSKTYQAANGKKYDIVTKPDWTVYFKSQDESLVAPIEKPHPNEAAALAEINAKNKWSVATWFLTNESSFEWQEESSKLTNPETLDLINTQSAATLANKDLYNKRAEEAQKAETEKQTNIQEYETASADEKAKLASINAERQANINTAQTTMLQNSNVIKESSERMARLQSNEHLDTIKKQYMAKGMTEEEANTQAASDINKQQQLERQTILQAQKDNAELNNQITQWGAWAQDTIKQAAESNAKTNTANVLGATNLSNEAENTRQAAADQAYTQTVQSVVQDNFKQLSNIQQQKVMETLGINLANKDSAFAAQTLLWQFWNTTNKAALAKALSGIKNWTMTLQQAQIVAAGWSLGGATNNPGTPPVVKPTTITPDSVKAWASQTP
jgi:hypothetical protein